MGTSHSEILNDDLFTSFHKPQWTRHSDQGLYELWTNSKTYEICQAYKLDSLPSEQDLEHYRFRHYKQTADNFVEIRYIDVQKNPTLCYHGQTYILTEFIPVKLTDMYDIPHADAYSILRSAYRAFHTMDAFHGPFVPYEDLIGVNVSGKPKIWLNRNHSKNRSNSVIKAEIWQKHVGQVSENVKRIFQMVEQRTINKQFPKQFRSFIYDNIMNFSQASQFVQDFCQQHKIVIPNSVQYLHFLLDHDLVHTINEHNRKTQLSPINDKMNTMESTYEHEKVGKQSIVKELKKSDSHQHFGLRENIHFVRSQNVITFTHQNQPTNVVPPPRSAFSPVVQRTSSAHIVIPPRKHVFHYANHQQSRISERQFTIPSQANLRSTVSVMQAQPLLRQIQVDAPQPILYQNLKTPAHVTANITIMPPNKITQFQLPVRKQSEKVESAKSGSVRQSASKAQSIHEKIKNFENEEDDVEYMNEPEGRNSCVEETKDQRRQEEFQNYINDNSQMQAQRSDDYFEENASEPDWQNMQAQNNELNQQNNHNFQQNQHNDFQYEEYHYEPQPYGVQLQTNQEVDEYEIHHQRQNEILVNKQDDISPIKENPVKNIEEFQNHYEMFTKYAKISNQKPQVYDNHEVVNSSSFQPRNIELNQSVISDQDNVQDIQIQENEISINRPNQISGLESSSQIQRNSSKNTSINKDSSGTLVVHESKQNIYNEISNDDRNLKVKHESIQQNSQESQNEEILEEENQSHKQIMDQLLTENYEEEERDEVIHQREHHQVPMGNLELNEYEWKHQGEHYDEVRQSGRFNNQEEEQETPRIEQREPKVNQYSNLHFRNESDELYQYTPVESVYRTENGKHVFPSFSRPTSSGVQDIVQLQSHKDIEEYIRNKYSGMIHGNQPLVNPPMHRQRSNKDYNNRAMTFAKPLEPQNREEKQVHTREYNQNGSSKQSKFQVNKIQSLYEKIDHYDSHITTQVAHRSDLHTPVENNDFLDVGNLEKSLDRKYKPHAEAHNAKISSPKSGHNVRGSQTMSEEDGMNVAALEQRLLKFEERQSIERQKSQRKIESQPEESSKNNNELLNFNELDNIVELMDKKIQESQKKQQNKSSQELKSNNHISEFAPGKQSLVQQLVNIDLQTSIHNMNNKEISLKDIPVLAKEKASKPASSRRENYNNKFGLDSQDFATVKATSSNHYSTGKDSYTFNKSQHKVYDSKKSSQVLNPVAEIERKYENYSSKNLHSNDYDLASLNSGSLSGSQAQRKTSRRSSRQVEEAKKLAEKIHSKYDQYMTGTSENYEVQKPFAKKSYTDIAIADPYEYNENYNSSNSRYQSSSSKYITEESKKVSKSSRVSARDNERKRSSYLNPIQQLNCENYASPLKQAPSYQNQENYLKLSNAGSRAPSGRTYEDKQSRKSSKVSYDELRDLLWK